MNTATAVCLVAPGRPRTRIFDMPVIADDASLLVRIFVASVIVSSFMVPHIDAYAAADGRDAGDETHGFQRLSQYLPNFCVSSVLARTVLFGFMWLLTVGCVFVSYIPYFNVAVVTNAIQQAAAPPPLPTTPRRKNRNGSSVSSRDENAGEVSENDSVPAAANGPNEVERRDVHPPVAKGGQRRVSVGDDGESAAAAAPPQCGGRHKKRNNKRGDANRSVPRAAVRVTTAAPPRVVTEPAAKRPTPRFQLRRSAVASSPRQDVQVTRSHVANKQLPPPPPPPPVVVAERSNNKTDFFNEGKRAVKNVPANINYNHNQPKTKTDAPPSSGSMKRSNQEQQNRTKKNKQSPDDAVAATANHSRIYSAGISKTIVEPALKTNAKPAKTNSEPAKTNSESVKANAKPAKTNSELVAKTNSESVKANAKPAKTSSELVAKTNPEPVKTNAKTMKSNTEPAKTNSKPSKSYSESVKPNAKPAETNSELAVKTNAKLATTHAELAKTYADLTETRADLTEIYANAAEAELLGPPKMLPGFQNCSLRSVLPLTEIEIWWYLNVMYSLDRDDMIYQGIPIPGMLDQKGDARFFRFPYMRRSRRLNPDAKEFNVQVDAVVAAAAAAASAPPSYVQQPAQEPQQGGRRNSVSDDLKSCVRCTAFFSAENEPGYAHPNRCRYHHGKMTGEFPNTKWSCCNSLEMLPGCVTASCHVWNGFVDGHNGPVSGFVSTARCANGGQLDFWLELYDPNDTVSVYALDCEMCYTSRGLEVTKVSLVDLNGDVVYHTLVRPAWPIVDYNTRYSGITAADFERGPYVSLRRAQRGLLRYIKANTLLIGHGLGTDLLMLRIIHHRVIDTSVMYAGPQCMKKSLKALSKRHLKRSIQASDGHDSREDARAAMDLALFQLYHNVNERIITPVFRNGPSDWLNRAPNAKAIDIIGYFSDRFDALARLTRP